MKLDEKLAFYPKLRTCKKCGKEKPALANFYKSTLYISGLMSECKQCIKPKKAEWGKTYREKRKEKLLK